MTYDELAIRQALNTTLLGKRVELYQQVGSTNDLARAAGRAGVSEGLVILAEEQIRGKGRLGRTWSAPPGSSILCSVLLRPRFSAQQGFCLTVAASLAILRAVRTLTRDTGAVCTLKWPNDVILNGRKLAGVLSESEFKGGAWAFAVVGFGINANVSASEFGELANKATSLSIELGREVDRTSLLAAVLKELEACYLSLQDGRKELVFQAWSEALETIGKQVAVQEPKGTIEGTAVRVDDDGALVVRTTSGHEHRVLAGDVT